MRKKNSNFGFSLVELMVVVAIIGILAAMSTGQISKQVAKSRQSEVKKNLATFYTVEKSFNAEYAAYWGFFGPIGYGAEGNVRYNVGVSIAGLPPSGYNGPIPAGGIAGSTELMGWCAGTGSCTLISTNGVAPPSVTNAVVTATSFVARGFASIFQAGVVDIWQIDDTKNLINVNSGL